MRCVQLCEGRSGCLLACCPDDLELQNSCSDVASHLHIQGCIDNSSNNRSRFPFPPTKKHHADSFLPCVASPFHSFVTTSCHQHQHCKTSTACPAAELHPNAFLFRLSYVYYA